MSSPAILYQDSKNSFWGKHFEAALNDAKVSSFEVQRVSSENSVAPLLCNDKQCIVGSISVGAYAGHDAANLVKAYCRANPNNCSALPRR